MWAWLLRERVDVSCAIYFSELITLLKPMSVGVSAVVSVSVTFGVVTVSNYGKVYVVKVDVIM